MKLRLGSKLAKLALATLVLLTASCAIYPSYPAVGVGYYGGGYYRPGLYGGWYGGVPYGVYGGFRYGYGGGYRGYGYRGWGGGWRGWHHH